VKQVASMNMILRARRPAENIAIHAQILAIAASTRAHGLSREKSPAAKGQARGLGEVRRFLKEDERTRGRIPLNSQK